MNYHNPRVSSGITDKLLTTLGADWWESTTGRELSPSVSSDSLTIHVPNCIPEEEDLSGGLFARFSISNEGEYLFSAGTIEGIVVLACILEQRTVGGCFDIATLLKAFIAPGSLIL